MAEYANIGNAFGNWRALQSQNALNRTRETQPEAEEAPAGDVGSRLMQDLQRDLGISPEQAAGIVGNLAHESGGFKTLQEINPLVEGSRGGYGYAQWTGPRRRQFEAWAEAQGLDPTSYAANYGFLKHELTNTSESRVMNSLAGADTYQDAAAIFSNQFLRPGIPHMENRLALAGRYASS